MSVAQMIREPESGAIEGGAQIFNLPVDMVLSNPFQPRRHFDPMALVDLATSIKQYGLMQPISVRINASGGYELVAGERRLKATKLAEIDTISAIIVEVSDEDSAVLALVENLLRENLNYIEEADGMAQLLTQHNLTQDQLAAKLGKNQSTIANKLRLLKLSPKIKKELIARGLSERHARALLKIQKELPEEQVDEVMLAIIQKVDEQSLTVQKTEELIDHLLAPKNGENKAARTVKNYIKDIRIFTNTIKQAVGIMQQSGVNAVYDIEDSSDGCIITVLVSY